MNCRDLDIGWTREHIYLLEEVLGKIGPEAPPDELRAGWEHSLWWERCYLEHLETGGELISSAEEWYQHLEHDLTLEESDDSDEVMLACRTCKDPVWANVSHASGKDMAAIYSAHVGHNIRVMLLEGGEDIVLECHTCQHVKGQDGIAILSGVVRDWFLELWNG